MDEKLETLKFILTRLDSYIESSQNKSNLYLALNTIILGGIITIISALKDLNCDWLLNLLLLLIAIASVVSIIITLLAINPYVRSSDDKKRSIFFFKDIASNVSCSNYETSLNKTIDHNLVEDLTSQVYSIAKGLNSKYQKLRLVGYIIAGEFILLAIWVLILLITR